MAFIRPTENGKWFKFDDDRVIPVTQREALNDNYGEMSIPQQQDGVKKAAGVVGVIEKPKSLKRFTNAYMLVYIKNSELGRVMAPVLDRDIPFHLRIFLHFLIMIFI